MDVSIMQNIGPSEAASKPIDILTEARLPLESEERSRVEYILQMSLQGRTQRATINDIVAVSNPHMSLRFQKRTSHIATLESWVDVSMLDSQNKLDSVINKGMVIGKKGLMFTHGSVELPRSIGEGNKLHQLILCQIGVGNAYCVDAASIQAKIDEGQAIEIPEGYDSLYVHPGRVKDLVEHTQNSAHRDTEHVPQHRFLIRDSDLVLPLYVLTCEIKNLDARRGELCNACEKADAIVFCHADNASLCDRCDKSIHGTSKVVGRHKRIPISEKPITEFGNCAHHPENTIAYYCHLCQVPVCIHCKMVGSHSAGDASTHKLTEIREAYDLALMASCKGDAFLAERKAHITTDVTGLHKKLGELTANVNEMEKLIQKKAEKAIDDLRKIAQEKISIVLSEENDLRRQEGRIIWLEEFLIYQQKTLGPVQFLEAWSRHVKYRAELHSPDPHSGIHRSRFVRPDITVIGDLTIDSDSSKIQIEDPADLTEAQRLENDVDDSDALRSELSLRFDILRDLDVNTSPSNRGHSPTPSIRSISRPVNQSRASSVSLGLAAPEGRSLKDLIAVYENGDLQPAGMKGHQTLQHRKSSVERRNSEIYKSPDQFIAEQMRTPSRRRVGMTRRDSSPAAVSDVSTMSKVSQSKVWSDVWSMQPAQSSTSQHQRSGIIQRAESSRVI